MYWKKFEDIKELYAIKGTFLLLRRDLNKFDSEKFRRGYVFTGIYREEIWTCYRTKKKDIVMSRMNEEGEFEISRLDDFDSSSFVNYCEVNLIRHGKAEKIRRPATIIGDIPLGGKLLDGNTSFLSLKLWHPITDMED